MTDFIEAREKMVDRQVRTNDITEHGLISAMLGVAREKFVPESMRELAFSDSEVPLRELSAPGRFLMSAAKFAAMVEAAEISSDDVVLIIGSGCGYSAAVVSQLASSVVAVEQSPELVEHASSALTENGFDNVVVLEGGLSEGYPKEAPYDVILLEGSIGFLPDAICEQLASGGRLIAAFGTGNAANLQRIERQGETFSARSVMNCALKPLPGFEKHKVFAL